MCLCLYGFNGVEGQNSGSVGCVEFVLLLRSGSPEAFMNVAAVLGFRCNHELQERGGS